MFALKFREVRPISELRPPAKPHREMVRPTTLGPAPPGTQSASPSPTFRGVSTESRRLLLVRHGQSVWNADGRWQGQADPPLSPLGEEQARDAAPRLLTVGFTRVVAQKR